MFSNGTTTITPCVTDDCYCLEIQPFINHRPDEAPPHLGRTSHQDVETGQVEDRFEVWRSVAARVGDSEFFLGN
jgi:hypothetical protein